MLKIYKHTFNAFLENTYVLTDESRECVIIDPGCNSEIERNQLVQTMTAHGLTPVALLNTHCHIDHFPGNKFVCDTYGLLPQFHRVELEVMYRALDYQGLFGFELEASPEPEKYLDEGDEVKFGNTTLKVFFTPGHSPGSISFYSENDKVLIAGDVIFRGSVGRYDLPGADGKTLFDTITQKVMTLPDEVKIYSGHGPETTVAHERKSNPFLNREFFFAA